MRACECGRAARLHPCRAHPCCAPPLRFTSRTAAARRRPAGSRARSLALCPPQVPGLGLRLDQTRLDLQYQEEYAGELPDAYERLLLDVVNGDKRLFIR